MNERRYHETLGQIPARAEDHQGCGRRRTAWKDLCGRCTFRRDRGDRTHPTTRSSTGHSERGLARLVSRLMLVLLSARSNQTRYKVRDSAGPAAPIRNPAAWLGIGDAANYSCGTNSSRGQPRQPRPPVTHHQKTKPVAPPMSGSEPWRTACDPPVLQPGSGTTSPLLAV